MDVKLRRAILAAVAATACATVQAAAGGAPRQRVAAGAVSQVTYRARAHEFALLVEPSLTTLALRRLDASGRPVATASVQPEPAPADIEGYAMAYDPRDDSYLVVGGYAHELRVQAIAGNGRRLGQASEVAAQALLVGLIYNRRRDTYLLLEVVGAKRTDRCRVDAVELDPSGAVRRPAVAVSPAFPYIHEFGLLASYDDRTGGYLVAWPARRGTVGRTLTAAGVGRGRTRRVGEGELLALTFDSRLGRYLGVFFRHDASGASKLQVEQLAADGAFRAHGETLRDPRNAAIGTSGIVYARRVDETLLDWTVQYGGFSEVSPEVNLLYADVLTGDGTRRLRRVRLDTVSGASDAIAAYDSAHRRFLAVWLRHPHDDAVSYGALIPTARR